MPPRNQLRTQAASVLPTTGKEDLARAFAVFFGAVLGITLLKFVNPCVLENLAEWPTNGYEWLIDPWPMVIGYWFLIAAVFFGLFLGWRTIALPKWLLLLPLVWVGWQFIAAIHTVDAELTRSTLKHFTACVACFYLGIVALGKVRNPAYFLLPLVAAFAVVLAIGIQQHFGGLEATRKYFLTYIYPETATVREDYLKRLLSDRIFSTQFYPNALAGVILLLLPASLALIWQGERRMTFGARVFLISVTGLSALACLYWSGSKGGWLLMLLLGLMALFRLQFSKRLKILLVAVVLVAGLSGFALKYAGFFQRGAKSVGARFDYWEAAVQTTAANPVFGTGPGTFAIAYKAAKRPESEMARLTHNDYLQQASDSGLLGFTAFLGLMVCGLVYGYPGVNAVGGDNLLRFSIWLGVLGWALQSLLEFGLYIPALSWCGFGWLGWLLGTAKAMDNPSDESLPSKR